MRPFGWWPEIRRQQIPNTQLQAGAEGHVRDKLSTLDRLQDLDDKIDAVGPAEISALALRAERVMVLFCHYLTSGNSVPCNSKLSTKQEW